MNAARLITLTFLWLLSSFLPLATATIICMSCATKHAVTHWNKFMNYRIMNSRTGTIMDDHPCDSPQNVTCNGLCYIFQITGTGKTDGARQLFAMAQGCAVGLFDGGARCFDRPVTLRGRGGVFRLDGHYCLCDGDLCTGRSETWIMYGPKKFYAQRHEAENHPVPIPVIAQYFKQTTKETLAPVSADYFKQTSPAVIAKSTTSVDDDASGSVTSDVDFNHPEALVDVQTGAQLAPGSLSAKCSVGSVAMSIIFLVRLVTGLF